MTQHRGPIEALRHDLQAPIAVRGFGSGWFAGFFALVLAIAGCGMVIALRWPGWFAMPEMAMVREWRSFRFVVHGVLLASYALALLSLLLRPRKVLGFTALGIGIFAAFAGVEDARGRARDLLPVRTTLT